jgi:hypothetical protein
VNDHTDRGAGGRQYGTSEITNRRKAKTILRLPDLEQSKTAVHSAADRDQEPEPNFAREGNDTRRTSTTSTPGTDQVAAAKYPRSMAGLSAKLG